MNLKTVYISIGNSDGRLSQSKWMYFTHWVDRFIRAAGQVHGSWYSLPNSEYQNACWCVELHSADSEKRLRSQLQLEKDNYRQDSIAWAEITQTEFL